MLVQLTFDEGCIFTTTTGILGMSDKAVKAFHAKDPSFPLEFTWTTIREASQRLAMMEPAGNA